MKKVTALNLPVGGCLPPTPTASLPGTPGRVLTKVKPAQRLKKTRPYIAFFAGAGRALSQYYDWLRRTDKPW
jgi:hypothetical protein